MINLVKVKDTQGEKYHYIEKLLVEAFPSEEYRPLNIQRQYVENKENFHCLLIQEEEKPIGLLTYWEFHTFCYIEHFAIDTRKRNKGLGEQAIRTICEKLDCPIVLEVEMPNNEISNRRIRFYQRQGFNLWDYEYKQPPYKTGDSYLPMLLMAHGGIKKEDYFEKVKETIYKEVYNV